MGNSMMACRTSCTCSWVDTCGGNQCSVVCSFLGGGGAPILAADREFKLFRGMRQDDGQGKGLFCTVLAAERPRVE